MHQIPEIMCNTQERGQFVIPPPGHAEGEESLGVAASREPSADLGGWDVEELLKVPRCVHPADRGKVAACLGVFQ